MEQRSVGRRTRKQEKEFFEKHYEEKLGKKLRKREVTHDSPRSPYRARKGGSGELDKDSERTRVSKGSDEPEDDIIWLEDEPRRGSLLSIKNKGLGEKRKYGDDADIAILAEEVVSNQNSSRVPSSLGSGMNSGCASRKKSYCESPEVVSSRFRREGEYIWISDDSIESGGPDDDVDKCSELNSSTQLDNDDPDDVEFEMGVGKEEEEREYENKDDIDDAGVDGGIHVSQNGESDGVEKVNVDDQFCDDGDDGESVETLKEGKHKEKKRKHVIEDGLIRQRVCGMDILVTCNKNGDNMDEGIANRLRSRFLSKSKIKKLKFGTISRPLIVDGDRESSSDSEDKLPPVPNYKPEAASDLEDIIESSSDSENMSESSSDSENTSKSSSDSENTFKSLSQEDTDLICKNKVQIDRMDIQTQKKRMENRKRKNKKKSTSNLPDIEKIMSVFWQEASCSQEKIPIKLPLKFTFDDENTVVQEKEEWEKENEALFDEMELALEAIEIGSFGPSTDDIPEPEAIAIELCREGKHDFKLDEEIGLICRHCSHVLEMKYILPDFAKDPFRRWEKKSLSADAVTNCSADSLKFPNYSGKGNSSVDVEGTVWDYVPNMKEKMYTHQHEGFEFIWGHFAGGISLEKLSLSDSLSDERSGCIINHAPGTGKTCLVIVFLLSFMRLYPKCRPIIVAPCTLLHNWELEFKKWNVSMPFYNLNKKLSKKEREKAKEQLGHAGKDITWSRLLKLRFWRQEQSVLAISYSLFVKLAGEHGKTKIMRDILLGLSDDILVLDEGHIARNLDTQILKTLSEVKTKRRIILSGTLFQNNFTELDNTLSVANPNFPDIMKKFPNLVDRIRGFRKKDRQPHEVEEEMRSLYSPVVWKGGDVSELKEMNDQFIHVYKGAILSELPGKKNYRIDLRPSVPQAKLLEIEQKVPNNLFRRKALITKISIHPSLVSDCKEFSDDDRGELKRLESSPDVGVKTKFVIELIRLCGALHERVLIFCQYLDPLKFIMNQLKSQFEWVEDREVLQMDGSSDQEKRKTTIENMNDPDSHARVLLASTGACNEGINLVGASRVVFLDVVYNPSVQTQAISRAYRIGQTKVVYVYHLITSGTLEVDDYNNQNQKEQLSNLVFTSKNKHCPTNDETVDSQAAVLEDQVLETMSQHQNLQNMFEKIYRLPD